MEKILTALIEGKPIKRDWWFDDDYLIVKNHRIWRYSEGREPEDFTEQAVEILSNIVNNTDSWMIGTKEKT